MDCMQYRKYDRFRQQAVSFQYRKRYGLHAIPRNRNQLAAFIRFQYRKRYGLHAMEEPLAPT